MNEDEYTDLIAEQQFQEDFSELIDCEIEDIKISEAEKQVLLETLLAEITTQIQTKSPNLNKLLEIIQK